LSILAGTATREDALPDVAAESVPKELSWGLRRYLERRAAAAPLTVVFDDIHWAEPALLDLIEDLAEWARAPLFLLCMARPDLREMRAGWGGGLMNASAIRLEPLSPDESARLIRELLAIDALPDDLRAQVIARSEGNPLYIEEFLRLLIDGGHVAKRDDRFVATASLETLVVPASLHALIAARLDSLPAAVKLVLQRGAVVGKVFWPEAIASQGPTDGRLEDLLRDAARHDMVSELDERGVGGGRAWTFKHILIRDVAYDAIPKAERSRAHDAFGRWLEGTSAERRDEYADIVVYHAEQAYLLAHELGEPDIQQLGLRAYSGLMASGIKAKERGDVRASRTFFERALAVSGGIELTTLERLSGRGRLAIARFELEPSGDTVDEIRAVASELRSQPPTVVLVDLLAVLSVQLSDKDLAAAATLDREAIDVAKALGDPEAIAWAMVRAQWVPWIAGDLEGQRRMLADAYAYVEASGARGALGNVLGGLGANAWQRGAFEDLAAYGARHRDWANANGSPVQRSAAAQGQAGVAQLRGDLDAALAFGRQAIELAVDAGVRESVGVSHWFVADALEAAGDLAGARAALQTSVDLLGGAALQGYRAETRTQLARVLVKLADLSEARHQAELARAEVGADDLYTTVTATWALAAVCAAEGRHEDAQRLYEQARERMRPTGYRLSYMNLQRDYAEFLIETGRATEAQPLLEEVRAFYDTPVTLFERERTDVLLRRCAPVKP
jgi:tetratricopeptide (TPR) repeat protein